MKEYFLSIFGNRMNEEQQNIISGDIDITEAVEIIKYKDLLNDDITISEVEITFDNSIMKLGKIEGEEIIIVEVKTNDKTEIIELNQEQRTLIKDFL